MAHTQEPDNSMLQDDSSLPHEIADRFAQPFARFLKIEAMAGAMLLLATAVALALSNSAWSTAFSSFWEMPVGLQFGPLNLTHSLRDWINDGLMTLFFFVVALELKREIVLGELRNFRMAALSFAGALGGMIVPAAFYLAFMHGKEGINGWGIVMATDTAFVIGGLALFGSRIPLSLRLFLLSLAIFDDVGAILIVAIGYGDTLNWTALAIGLLGLAAVWGSARIGIRRIAFYFLLGGGIWLCFDRSGIHPTIVGVILGLMTPARGWVSDERLHAILGRILSYPSGDHWSGDTVDRSDLRRASTAATETLSPIERLEIMLLPWVGFLIMPLFAFANAGTQFLGAEIELSVLTAIFVGLVVGKPMGVILFSWLAVRFGLATLAPTLSWSLLIASSLLTGIGFTMSLFVAGLAFDGAMLHSAKIGILTGSLTSAGLGLSLLAWLIFRKRMAKSYSTY